MKKHPSSSCRRHRTLILARSGSTSRFPLRNRCLWEEADETLGRQYSADQRRPRFPWRRSHAGSDLLWEREKHEEGQNRGCSGSTELAIVVSRRSWREISLWKAGDRHKERKEEQKERNAGGNCARLFSIRGGNPRSLRISSNDVSFRGPHNHLDAELLQARWVLGAIDPEQFVE